MVIYLAGLSLSLLWMKITFEIAYVPLLDLRAIYNQIRNPGILYSGNMPMGLSNLTIYFIKAFFFSLCFVAGVSFFRAIFLDLLHFIRGFSFPSVSLQTSSALLTRFQFIAPISWFRDLFHSEKCELSKFRNFEDINRPSRKQPASSSKSLCI